MDDYWRFWAKQGSIFPAGVKDLKPSGLHAKVYPVVTPAFYYVYNCNGYSYSDNFFGLAGPEGSEINPVEALRTE